MLISIQIVLFVHIDAVFTGNAARRALCQLLRLFIEIVVRGVVAMIVIMHRDLVLTCCIISH